MKSHSRFVRVFISSTFRDFQAERQLCVTRVFPELRRPSRLDVAQSLVTAIIASHIRNHDEPMARKIAERCPHLGFKAMLISPSDLEG